MGELMEVVQRWAWLASLLALGCWGAGAIRYWRKAAQLDLEAYKERPLIPDDKVAMLRPGDTCLLLCQLEDMTLHQQERLIESLGKFVSVFKERGIALVIIPEFGGQKVFVISSDGNGLYLKSSVDGDGSGDQGSP